MHTNHTSASSIPHVGGGGLIREIHAQRGHTALYRLMKKPPIFAANRFTLSVTPNDDDDVISPSDKCSKCFFEKFVQQLLQLLCGGFKLEVFVGECVCLCVGGCVLRYYAQYVCGASCRLHGFVARVSEHRGT